MSVEERLERLEKLVNMILDNMSMRAQGGEVKNPQKHFTPFLKKEDKE
jgi:hypothetical protein